MGEPVIKHSGAEVVTRRFPAVFTIERWSGSLPSPTCLTVHVGLFSARPGAGKQLARFDGHVEGDPPRFVVHTATPPGADAQGPNNLWLRLNASTEEPLYGPFPLTMDGAAGVLLLIAQLDATVTAAPCIVRPAERALKVEPLSQQSSKFGDATWDLGKRIRDTWHGGAATLDRDWKDVVMRARP
jgi:hypothetical protein